MVEFADNRGPTLEAARGALDYCPDTGVFVWKYRAGMPAKWNTRFAGKEAGTRNRAGYRMISLNYRITMAHRLAWLLMTGSYPPGLLDHINGDRADNRFANLRLATVAENSWNSRAPRNNTSGFKGVSRCAATGKWVAMIRSAPMRKVIGRFDTPEAAHAAYVAAAEQLHGQFAYPG